MGHLTSAHSDLAMQFWSQPFHGQLPAPCTRAFKSHVTIAEAAAPWRASSAILHFLPQNLK